METAVPYLPRVGCAAILRICSVFAVPTLRALHTLTHEAFFQSAFLHGRVLVCNVTGYIPLGLLLRPIRFLFGACVYETDRSLETFVPEFVACLEKKLAGVIVLRTIFASVPCYVRGYNAWCFLSVFRVRYNCVVSAVVSCCWEWVAVVYAVSLVVDCHCPAAFRENGVSGGRKHDSVCVLLLQASELHGIRGGSLPAMGAAPETVLLSESCCVSLLGLHQTGGVTCACLCC